jgi:hypothetical protein
MFTFFAIALNRTSSNTSLHLCIRQINTVMYYSNDVIVFFKAVLCRWILVSQ